MLESIFEFLKDFNNNYAQTGLFLIALVSLLFVYNEFVAKTRPYVLPEISIQEDSSGKWNFFVVLVNKGDKPGIGKISDAILKIGDEKYPTLFEQEVVLAPDEKRTIMPIGNINAVGIGKIRGHEYVDNTVTISLKIQSRVLGDKKYKYTTIEEYKVDVSGEKPQIILLKEQLN